MSPGMTDYKSIIPNMIAASLAYFCWLRDKKKEGYHRHDNPLFII